MKTSDKKPASITLFGTALSNFMWVFLVVPFLYAGVVFYISSHNYMGWQISKNCKDLMEVVHPVILLTFTLVVLQSWRLTRRYIFGWLFVLGVSLFFRELHFWGTSTGNYIVLITLAVIGYRHPDRLKALLTHRWAITFFILCFCCYFCMEILDRGIAKRIGRLILQDSTWKLPYYSNMEECLETLGGFCLLLSSFFIKRE